MALLISMAAILFNLFGMTFTNSQYINPDVQNTFQEPIITAPGGI
jgi:hypothetical protein